MRPGMPAGRARLPARIRDAINPRVYGCSGRRNRAETGAASTIRPAYMTLTKSHISATSPRSWVMSNTVSPSSCCSDLSSSMIWSWTVTSSAVVGSSARSTDGRHASARAIITRWHIPPDS